jgi:hypothetical protein
MNTNTSNEITFTPISCDRNANPRYVCHYLALLTEKEKMLPPHELPTPAYSLAITRSKKWKGRKFDNKKYSGGIVFTTYNVAALSEGIRKYIDNLQNN